MLPMYFGPSDRPLLGVYHDQGSGSNSPVAVLCNPFGDEYICAFRSMRVLASRLAAAGIPAFRFDYSCTGDSSGHVEEGDPEIWLQDIRTAMEEAMANSGREEVCLVGLRVGASLAAMVAAEGSPATRLVLWEPVVDGNEYLNELKQRHEDWLTAQASYFGNTIRKESSDDESLGFPVTERIRQQFGQIDLTTLSADQIQNTLVLSSLTENRIAATLGQQLSVQTQDAESFWCLQPEFDRALVPIDCIKQIVSWATGESA